jgi:uncharacterized protein YdhG (YjbR/CyaY superfamily)
MCPVTIDQYLADLEEPKRSTLQRPPETILEVAPDAQEAISYIESRLSESTGRSSSDSPFSRIT